MKTINITPAAKRIAEEGGLYIERDTVKLPTDDGGEQTVDSIVIAEENSDFYVEYLVKSTGLALYTWATYLDWVPGEVASSVGLRKLVKELVAACRADDPQPSDDDHTPESLEVEASKAQVAEAPVEFYQWARVLSDEALEREISKAKHEILELRREDGSGLAEADRFDALVLLLRERALRLELSANSKDAI